MKPYLLALTVALHAQTTTFPASGPIRSLSLPNLAAAPQKQKLFELPSSTPHAGIQATVVAAPALAVATTPTNDLKITNILTGKSITVGGSGIDTPTRAVRDSAGNYYILGNTTSPDFPVTRPGPNPASAFLLKLDAELNTIYATYLGTASLLKDDFQDLAVDASGSVFVVASSAAAELAPNLHGAGAWISTNGLFDVAGAGSFRSTVAAWLNTPTALYAATAAEGLFRSTDQGQSWTAVPIAPAALNLTAIAGDGQTLYVGTTRALYRSTNGGATWAESTGSGIRALSVSPRDRNIVYAALQTNCGLLRSADAGRTWQNILPAGTCVAALATGSDDVYAFIPERGVYLASTSQLLDTIRANTAVAAGSSLYAATSTGISKSIDGGKTWNEVLATPDVTALAASPDGQTVAAGTMTNGILLASVADDSFTRIDDAAIQQPVRSVALLADGAVAAGTNYQPDLYVAKVGPRGDQILFSTFIGGLGAETSPRIALDNAGNILVGATTDSADVIATFDAAQRRYAGGLADLFVAKLNANFEQTALTYYGGTGLDTLGGIGVDSRNFVYVTGSTTSPDLAPGDATKAFLVALSPNLGSFAHRSYVPFDSADTLAVSGNEIWIGGGTNNGADGLLARYSDLVAAGTITGVRNGASLESGVPVAPGSNVVIEGAGFGNSLFGLTVRMGATEASVIRASDTRLEVVAPEDLEPGKTFPITVTSRSGVFQGTAQAALLSPGIFSANRDGKGAALAQVLRIDTDGVQTITPTYECADEGACVNVPVDLGDECDQLYLLLRATGIRNHAGLDSIQVSLNGIAADVISAQALDAFSGADRIVVKLPREVGDPNGVATREVTIQVTVEGQSANPVTILIG